jgi:hypothetical protein
MLCMITPSLQEFSGPLYHTGLHNSVRVCAVRKISYSNNARLCVFKIPAKCIVHGIKVRPFVLVNKKKKNDKI